MKTFRDKKIFASILALLALTLTVVIIHGCGVSSYESTADTTSGSISITKAGVVQVNAAPIQMTATLADGTNVTTQVVWSSDHPEIATVDSSGFVTAHMAGHATVTATMGGQTGTFAVTCYAPAGH